MAAHRRHSRETKPTDQVDGEASSRPKNEFSFSKHALSTNCMQRNLMGKWSESREYKQNNVFKPFQKTLWGKHHKENIYSKLANQNHQMWQIMTLLGIHCRNINQAEFFHNLIGYILHFSLWDKR